MSDEDLYWERTAQYGFFAERYGWTPEQVRALPSWYSDRLPGFAAMVEEVREKRSKK